MFASAIQPSIVSLFSSTGSDPLSLFSIQTDQSLASDSFIHLLNDSTSLPTPLHPVTLVSLPSLSTNDDNDNEKNTTGYSLSQTVLHIQSPTLRTTYIQCPPASGKSGEEESHTRRSDNMNAIMRRPNDLGMKHPWMHIQVRNMAREWSFEVGLVDQLGREGVVRCSTFQKEPRLKLSSTPLLHLPLSFPSESTRPLTAWSTIALNLPTFLPHFSSTSLIRDENNEDGRNNSIVAIPSGTYSHVSYVKVYATCRLKRIWFSETGPSQRLPWEFQLLAAD